MEVIDCNNHVKSAIGFFGPSCAVNSLSDKYNPLGDNSHKLCEICGSDLPGVKCTSNDPYAGYQGALSCLFEQGDIAFVKHSSVLEYFNTRSSPDLGVNPDLASQGGGTYSGSNFFPYTTTTSTYRPFPQQNFVPFSQQNESNLPFGSPWSENDRAYGMTSTLGRKMTLADFKASYDLLCSNGERRNIEDWRSCYWGELPSHVVVTTSAKDSEVRLRYQKFIQNLAQQFGGSSNTGFQSPATPQPSQFGSFGQRPVIIVQPPSLFESFPRYGNRSNLLFSVIIFNFNSHVLTQVVLAFIWIQGCDSISPVDSRT